jgi:DNA-binding response OmpR family regulator
MGVFVKNQKTILIVEDKMIPAEYLSSILKENGYIVLEIADTGCKAIEIAKREKPDIILMDIMLKGQMSGIEASTHICHHNSDCKIIYLTAYSNKEIIESAYESRAYAYLLKPYREQEILSTIHFALLDKKKNIKKEISDIKLKSGYYFNKKLRRLYKNGKEVSLSKNGHKFMEILAQNRDSTVSNEQICYHIWYRDKNINTLRALVHRIREKVDIPLIKNIKGMGYITYSI